MQLDNKVLRRMSKNTRIPYDLDVMGEELTETWFDRVRLILWASGLGFCTLSFWAWVILKIARWI